MIEVGKSAVNAGHASNGHAPSPEDFPGHTGDVLAGDAWDELLSAYLDGEVSAAERVLVENWLARDPAARQTLVELRRLSTALRDLPREAAPPEVQRLAVERTRDMVGPAKPAARRSRRREWIAGLTALAATGLMALMLRQSSTPETWAPASPVAGGSFGLRPAADFLGRGGDGHVDRFAAEMDLDAVTPFHDGLQADFGATSAMLADGDADTRDARLAGRNWNIEGRMRGAPMTAPAAGEGTITRSEPLAANEPTMNELPAITAYDAPKAKRHQEIAERKSDWSEAPELEAWRQAQPYLSLVCRNSTAIANVDLVVVDVDQAAGEFEALLLEQGVGPTPDQPPAAGAPLLAAKPAEARPDMTRAKDEASPPDLSDETVALKEAEAREPKLTALYVEANGEVLTKALEALVERRQLLTLNLQQPLEVPPSPVLVEANGAEPTIALNAAEDSRVLAERLAEAYVGQQQRGLSRQWSDGPVSALDQVANHQPLTDLELTPLMAGSTPRYAYQLPQNAPLKGQTNFPEAESVVTQNNSYFVDPQGQVYVDELGLRPIQNFQQRVELKGPMTNWYRELAAAQNGLQSVAPGVGGMAPRDPAEEERLRRGYRNNQYVPLNTNDLAFKKQLQSSGDQTTNDFRLMRGQFQQAAPDAVRVIFVIQPPAEPQPAGQR